MTVKSKFSLIVLTFFLGVFTAGCVGHMAPRSPIEEAYDAIQVSPAELEEAKRSPSYEKYPALVKLNKFFDIEITGGLTKKKARQDRKQNEVSLALLNYQTFDVRARITLKAGSALEFPVRFKAAYAVQTIQAFKGTSYLGFEASNNQKDKTVVEKNYTLASRDSVIQDTVSLEYMESAINENFTKKIEMKLAADPEIFVDIIHMDGLATDTPANKDSSQTSSSKSERTDTGRAYRSTGSTSRSNTTKFKNPFKFNKK